MKCSKNKREKQKGYNLVESKGKVTEALKDKKIDFAINTCWPFIAPFMKFLDRSGIMKGLGVITGIQIRKMLSPHVFTLIYILKIIIGVPTIRGSEKLLGDLGAMNVVGFNVDSLMEGMCKRGDANQYGNGYKKNSMRHGRFYIDRQY